MWRIYGKEEGIAIVSTWEKIKESAHGNEPMFGGIVHYLNYQNVAISFGSFFAPYLHKLRRFDYKKNFAS